MENSTPGLRSDTEIERENARLREENQALRSSLTSAEDLLRIAPAFFGFLSPLGIILDLNDLSFEAIGETRAQAIGQYFWQAAWWQPVPASAQKIRSAVELAARGEASSFDVEYWAKSPNEGEGTIRWVALQIVPLFSPSNKVARLSATGIDVTDRVETQARFFSSEQKLMLALEAAKIGYWELDPVTKIVTMSEQMLRDWGIDRKSSTSDLDEGLNRIHLDDRDRVRTAINSAIQLSAPYDIEYRVLKRPGEIVWIRAHGKLSFSANGVKERLIGTSVDITAMKQATETLAVKQHKLEAIFEQSPAAMALLRGPGFLFERVNPRFRSLLGGRDFLGKTFLEGLPELSESPYLNLMKRVFETGERYSISEIPAKVVRRPEGPVEQCYWDFTCTRINDGEGRPYGVYNLIYDVTETVFTRRRIEESEARFRQLADAMPQIVWTARADGQIDYYNWRWYEFTGGRLNNGGEESWVPTLHPDDVDATRNAWRHSLETGESFQIEQRIIESSTQRFRWHLSRGIAIRNENGRIEKWFGTSTDIHTVKEIQENLTRSNSELARFAFVASHDLKEPLRVISNYAQMLKLQHGGKLGGKADQYIEFIVNSVRRMYELINDVLTFSSVGVSRENFKPTNLNETLKTALANLEASIKESEATFEISPLPTLWVEPSQMIQVFQNLLSNSIKYRAPGRSPHIKISASKKSSNWIFSVQDNGIGIESKYFEKIFVIFQRLHARESFSGTGIGLAICKKTVEVHGGKIWAESEVGKGSTFFFQLPEPNTKPETPSGH